MTSLKTRKQEKNAFLNSLFLVSCPKIYWPTYQRQRGFYMNAKSSALMSKTVENASTGIPQGPKQKEEVLYLLHGTV